MSCSKTDSKDIYLQSILPRVLDLEKEEIDEFKKSMEFNENGKLEYWNIDILEKAYNAKEEKEEFAHLLTYLDYELGETPDKFIFVDLDNSEVIYIPSFKDLNDMKHTLGDIRSWDAMYYVASTNCSYCVSNFSKMNEISTKNKEKGLKFVAIFENIDNISRYKNGEVFKLYGFLNEDWIILPKKNLLYLLSESYSDEMGFPYLFFRKDQKDLGEYSGSYDEIDTYIEENF